MYSTTIGRADREELVRAGRAFSHPHAGLHLTTLATACAPGATASSQGSIYLTGHDTLLPTGQAGIAQPVAPSDSPGWVAAMASTRNCSRAVTVLAVLAAVTTAVANPPAPPLEEPQPHPNVVILLFDDIGTDFLSLYDDINPYRTDLPYVHGEPGAGDIPGNGPGATNLYANTPTIQSLADTGVTFMNAYAMPICSPSRASLLTGEYPVRHGIGQILRFDHDGGTLNEFGDPGFDFPTLAELVQQVGYDDSIFGKWHLGAPRPDMHSTEGRDYHLGWASIPERGHFSAWHCVFNGVNTVPDPPSELGTYYDWYFNRNHTAQAEVVADPDSLQSTYATIVQVEEALAWCNSRTVPFFCLLTPNAAHGPWGLLPPTALTTTAEYTEYPLNAFSGHCAAIEALDTMLGQFVDGLDPLKREKTLFILAGDNGTPATCVNHARSIGPIGTGVDPGDETHAFTDDLHGSEKLLGDTYNFLLNQEPSRFKHTVYEKGIRIPLIVSGYGVTNGGRVSHALVDIVDVYPTIAEILDESTPPDQHGISFAPVLRDEVAYFTHARNFSYSEVFSPTGNTNPGTVFTERQVACSMIIPGAGRYKIVRDLFGATGDELYRLQDGTGGWDDPFEIEPIDHGPDDPAFGEYLLVQAKMEAIMASGDDTGPNTCEMAESFCSSTPNSSGGAAVMDINGSCSVSLNNLVLIAEPVPNGFGIFYYSATRANGGDGSPFGNGLRCVGGSPIYRLPTISSSSGRMSHDLGITSPESPAGQIGPSSTWHIQAWFRDPAAGGAEFNHSDGLTVTFSL